MDNLNEDCEYYPCHKKLENCTFCYCPFYPCYNPDYGKFIRIKKKRIWDCSNCTWIHENETVNCIYIFIKQKFNLP
jgi:precorrin-3B C17-methyltransferase